MLEGGISVQPRKSSRDGEIVIQFPPGLAPVGRVSLKVLVGTAIGPGTPGEHFARLSGRLDPARL